MFDPSNGPKNVDVHINTLYPGVTAGSIHYHRAIEDIYVILEGEGKIVDSSGREFHVKAGQAVFLRPGENIDPHEIYNIGSGPMRFIEIYAPPHPETYYKDRIGNRGDRDHVLVRNT